MKITSMTLTILIAIQFSACTKDDDAQQTTNPAVPSEVNPTKMKNNYWRDSIYSNTP